MECIVPEKNCTGCSACMNICPCGAISMKENVVGHKFPSIVANACVDCSLCEEVCPAIKKKTEYRAPQLAYAAWAENQQEHHSSTSGGIAAVVSRYVINNGGVVYGCTCNSGGIIEHERISEEDQLYKLKGSKYVQSDIGYIYRQIKSDLEMDVIVLFIGTPCQVSGLKSYLAKEYDKLWTIDLICHGVPPQKLLFEHLEEQGIERKEITNIKFREQSGFYVSVQSGEKTLYRKSDLKDIYYSAFFDALTYRESCINCLYAKPQRVGDLTIGDFHGLGKVIPFNENRNGLVSVVLVNTPKGQHIIKECDGKLVLHERPVSEAVSGNPQLNHPSKRRADYEKFVKRYTKDGFGKAAKKTLKIRRIKNVILSVLQKG